MSMKILSVRLIKADAEQRFDIEEGGKYWTIRFEIRFSRERRNNKTGREMKALRAGITHTQPSRVLKCVVSSRKEKKKSAKFFPRSVVVKRHAISQRKRRNIVTSFSVYVSTWLFCAKKNWENFIQNNYFVYILKMWCFESFSLVDRVFLANKRRKRLLSVSHRFIVWCRAKYKDKSLANVDQNEEKNFLNH